MSAPVDFRQSLRSALLLGAFAVAAALLLDAAWRLTAERIHEAQRATLAARLAQILPPERYDNDLLADRLEVALPPEFGMDRPAVVWRARRHGRPVALLIQTRAPDGYGGPIDLLMGVAPDGRVIGVRVTSHRETPGLGDKIELSRSPWIHVFAGKALDDPPASWRVRKDGGTIDQFAGATITPRAVVRAVRRTLEWAVPRIDELFAAPAQATANRDRPS